MGSIENLITHLQFSIMTRDRLVITRHRTPRAGQALKPVRKLLVTSPTFVSLFHQWDSLVVTVTTKLCRIQSWGSHRFLLTWENWEAKWILSHPLSPSLQCIHAPSPCTWYTFQTSPESKLHLSGWLFIKLATLRYSICHLHGSVSRDYAWFLFMRVFILWNTFPRSVEAGIWLWCSSMTFQSERARG